MSTDGSKSLLPPLIAAGIGFLMMSVAITYLVIVIAGILLGELLIEFSLSNVQFVLLAFGIIVGIYIFVLGYVEYRMRELENRLRSVPTEKERMT